MILLLSRIAGCRGWDATADWAEAHDALFRQHLDLWKTPPGADTLRRTAEAYALEDFLDAMAAEGETVHIDGKRLRGAGRDGKVHHLVEALCGSQVIGLVETGAGAEGPAIQHLVADLGLGGRLVTIDAAGERREVGGQATLAKSAMGLTSASNSGSKPDPSLPLRTAHWSRRSAPLRDHRICWNLFMRRLTRKLAVPSVIDVPTRRPTLGIV